MLENRKRNPEIPREEMARLIRTIAGKRQAGETDEQLRFRAARRLGITPSRAKVFWYGETDNIRSDEMDRARELAFVQPIQEVADAVETFEAALAGLRDRLYRAAGLDRRSPASRNSRGYRRRLGDMPGVGARLLQGVSAALTDEAAQ